MKWNELHGQVQLTMLFNSPPAMIIIHLGGNDLVTIKQGKLIKSIKRDLNYISSVFPSALIVWSDILPRLSWRGITPTLENLGKINRKRKCINRAGRQMARELPRGRVIIHEIDTETKGLFSRDEVHLSPVGNDIFLSTLSEAIDSFLKNPVKRLYDANQ